jgi:hypothetical protein
MAKSAPKPPGIPVMITQDMNRRLRDSGLDQSAIDKMTPQQAHAHLGERDPDTDDDDGSTERVNAKQASRARHRSPNYPFINLEKAIERTRQIYEADRRHEVPIRVVSEKRWEFKAGSSQGDQTVAALRAFGLVEVTGSSDKRMVRISDRAYRILAGANDAAERIKDAALAPAIHGELWQKYGTDGLPSSDVIRNYLLFEREAGRFNEDVVDAFIDRFKETISFAKLESSDKIDEVEVEEKDEESMIFSPPELGLGFKKMQSPLIENPPSGTKPIPQGVKQDAFISETGEILVKWPARLAATDREDLTVWLDRVKRRILGSVESDSGGVANHDLKDDGPAKIEMFPK